MENCSWLKLTEEFTPKTTSNWRLFGRNSKKFAKLKGNGELFVIKAYWRIYAKNNVKLANFWSVLTGLSSKVEKNSSNWKEIENSSWLKLTEEFTRKTTSNWRIFGQFWRSKFEIRKNSSNWREFFVKTSNSRSFSTFARIFASFSTQRSKIAIWPKIRQNRPTLKLKSQLLLVLPSLSRFFSLKCGEKNVGKLLILYLSHKNVFCFHFVIANVQVCLLLSREGGRPQKAQNATAITKLKNKKNSKCHF